MTTSDWNAPTVLSMGPFGLHCLPATYFLAGGQEEEGGGKEGASGGSSVLVERHTEGLWILTESTACLGGAVSR